MIQVDLHDLIRFNLLLKQKSFDSDSIHDSIQNRLQVCLLQVCNTHNQIQYLLIYAFRGGGDCGMVQLDKNADHFESPLISISRHTALIYERSSLVSRMYYVWVYVSCTDAGGVPSITGAAESYIHHSPEAPERCFVPRGGGRGAPRNSIFPGFLAGVIRSPASQYRSRLGFCRFALPSLTS